MRSRPRVVLVGCSDVDARLDLMRALSGELDFAAVGSRPELAQTFEQEGFRYRAYHLDRAVNALHDITALLELRRIFRELAPDLVHTFDTKPSIYGRLAARSVGVPRVIGTITGLGSLYADATPRTRLLRAVYEPLQRAASKRSDVTVFQNEIDRDEMVARGIVAADRAVVLSGSGVHTGHFDPEAEPAERAAVRAELGVAPDETLVLMVSRVIRTKGVLTFAAAMDALRDMRPRCRGWLVGAVDSESLDALTPDEEARLRTTLTWRGPRRDIRAALAAADAFVLPTWYREGVPRSLLEAAAMRRALVTTKVPGCASVVEHEDTGLLVPPRDVAALASAIRRLATDAALRERLGRSAREHVAARFDLGRVVDAHRALYSRVLSAGSA